MNPHCAPGQQATRPGGALADLAWSLAALVLMNGTVQIVLYPRLSRLLGTEEYGNMLFVVGIATIFGAGIGCAVSNARLLRQRQEYAGNLDYLLCLLGCTLPACLAAGAVAWQVLPPVQAVLAAVLTLAIALRYYSDVEYRLSLNYRTYFVYYLLLSAGYLAGLLLWKLVPSWPVVLLLGEGACVLFCMAGGKIYHPLTGHRRTAELLRGTAQLMLSYLLYNAVVQLDRVFLRMVMDSRAVTLFYVASLLGKAIALLVGPLNTVLVSRLTRREQRLDFRRTLLLTGAVVVCAGVFYLAVSLAAPVVVRWLYPELYDLVLPYTALANLGQILCFAGSLELTLLLTLAPARWQLLIQGGYALLFAAGGLYGVQTAGLAGFVWATAAAGAVRFAAAVGLLLYYAGRNRQSA